MAQACDMDSAIYENIGRVVVRWAYIESLLGQFLAYLLDADQGKMNLVTQNVSGSTITDWLRALYPHRFADLETLDRLGLLFSRVDDIRSTRNAYAHGLWSRGHENDTAMLQTIRWERREIIRDELVTAADLADTLHHIEEIGAELLMLGDKLGFHPQQKSGS